MNRISAKDYLCPHTEDFQQAILSLMAEVKVSEPVPVSLRKKCHISS